MHGLFILVVSELLSRRVNQLLEYGLALVEVLSRNDSEPVFKHIERIPDLEGGFSNIMWVILRTVETQSVWLSSPAHFCPIRYVHWFSFPISWNGVELHEFHDVFSHCIVVVLFVDVSEEM